ncbi:hypothetical protein SeLEV6574_g02491 [Synchytrium endobioticum]|uniref:SnoaL-like domain-containing protein n=1 Tax=Synchytrium endobioticum TaxID=286115 RepID=A0A507DA10_9FUNG|nr:hypothetical protein SeLEV6574_g02491 [Synchytrium endobioticum]
MERLLRPTQSETDMISDNIAMPCTQFTISEAMKHASEYYAEDASIVYLPTGMGASPAGPSIREFCNNYLHQTRDLIEEQLISTMNDGKMMMTESILTVIHESNMDWLLPNVKPTNKRILVPMTTIATLDDDGRIQRQRSYFDQASVLKQVGILPQSLFCKANGLETTLPVLNGRIADLVKGSACLNTLIGNDKAAGLSTAQVSDATSPRCKKNSAAPAHGILPHARDEQVPHASSVIPQGDAPVANHRNVQAPGGKGMSAVFGGEADAEVIRPSTRGHHAPGGDTHFNIFAEATPLPVRSSVSVDPQRNKNNVNVFSDNASVAPRQFNSKRDPNWLSGASIGGDTRPCTPHSAKKMNPNAENNKSHFDFGGGKAEAEDEPEWANGKRLFADVSRRSSIGFHDAGMTPVTEKTEDVKAAGIARHDRNVRSDDSAAYIRPSSRVLNVPGGRSTFQFG